MIVQDIFDHTNFSIRYFTSIVQALAYIDRM